jgi:TRAP-type uncharacterized transport system substrate-binding protein
MRKTVAAIVIVALIALGGAAAALYLYSRPRVLRVATPQNVEDARLLSAAEQIFRRHRESVRLRLVPVADFAAAATALDSETVDLAVVRADVALPTSAQTIIILHRNAALLIAPPGSKLRRVADLRGKRVGVVHEATGMEHNAHLLEIILAQYDIAPKNVIMVPLEPDDVRAAVEGGKVDAVFTVAVPQRGLNNDVVGAVSGVSAKPPVFLPISEAKAISKRFPALDPMEIVQGAFGGDPPRPAAALDGASVSVLLAARSTLKDAVAGQLSRLFFAHRGVIALTAPLANSIEAPSTDKGAAVPTHQGVVDYLDGNEHTFFDQYSDVFYIAAMLLSLVGSGAAALLSRFNRSHHERAEELTEKLLGILQKARCAASADELDGYERDVDEVLCETLSDRQLHRVEGSGLHVVTLALDQVRRTIHERRHALGKEGSVVNFPTPRAAPAAE